MQDRLVFAARIDRDPADGVRITDYQTATLYAEDEGWTTRGEPEGRNKESHSFRSIRPGGTRVLTDERYRDYYADMRVTVALRIDPPTGEPTLDAIAGALKEPSRPLFIGRKPCMPSSRLFADFSKGETTLAALLAHPLSDEAASPAALRTLWPDGEGLPEIEANSTYMLTDQRDWVSGLHGGGRWVCERAIERYRFASAIEAKSPEKEGQA